MKRLNLILLTGVFLGTFATALAQPTIAGLTLEGRPQTVYDAFHPYASLSASPGADVSLKVAVSGAGPLTYQWSFEGTRLANETNQSLRLASLDRTNGGSYTVQVSNRFGAVTSHAAVLNVDPTFTKITASPVVTNVDFSQGGFWCDYDNDGWLDLFVVNGQGGVAANAFLYRNQGDGSFAQVTAGPPVDVLAEAPAACWGDFDNDGNPDLFVATTGTHQLFRNNGNGDWSRILNARMLMDSGNSFGCSWADYDGDGFLDLFVTTLDPTANAHCWLYRNQGDGTFISITTNALVTDRGSSIGCGWCDYDGDGKPDLLVCGGRGPGSPSAPNRLYHNDGNGKFTRVTSGSLGSDLGHCGCCGWGDYDNDGFPDLFVPNGFGGRNFLYRNNGQGGFDSIQNSVLVTDVGTNAWGCAWADYDNDGFLDLFVTNQDDANGTRGLVNSLYHNNGDGTFSKVTTGSPVNEYSDSIGCAWADYDNDGFPDLFVTRGDRHGNCLYHNNGNGNAWLALKLIGAVSNRLAIGAKVRVKAFYRGGTRWQLRQITGGGGWAGQQDLRANFGLGDATNAEVVRIEWPSGIVQELGNIAPRQILTINEPPRLLSEPGHRPPRFFLKGGRGMQYDIQTSTDAAAWSFAGTLTVTNLDGMAEITATNAPPADRRFFHAVSH
jgi:hypothetical protein